MRNELSSEEETTTDDVPAAIRNQVFQIGVNDAAPETMQESPRKEENGGLFENLPLYLHTVPVQTE